VERVISFAQQPRGSGSNGANRKALTGTRTTAVVMRYRQPHLGRVAAVPSPRRHDGRSSGQPETRPPATPIIGCIVMQTIVPPGTQKKGSANGALEGRIRRPYHRIDLDARELKCQGTAAMAAWGQVFFTEPAAS